MSNRWGLPEQLSVAGGLYAIRTDYKVALDCMIALEADDLNETEKADVVCRILYPDWREIYRAGHFTEAVYAAYAYLSCGKEQSGKVQPSVMSWDKDAPIIFDAINRNRAKDIRTENMHWWTFCGLYSEIGESTFNHVVAIRWKKATGKKLEKHEKEFVKNHPEYFTNKSNMHEDDFEEYAALLDGGDTDGGAV